MGINEERLVVCMIWGFPSDRTLARAEGEGVEGSIGT